jgi:hypothetical protein
MSIPIPTLEQFLAATNRRARRRLFDPSHYDLFIEHVRSAGDAAAANEPWYWECNGGFVGRSYKYSADTARCGVYTLPAIRFRLGVVVTVFDRARASVNVPCIYRGGERSYLKDFRERRRKEEWWFV